VPVPVHGGYYPGGYDASKPDNNQDLNWYRTSTKPC